MIGDGPSRIVLGPDRTGRTVFIDDGVVVHDGPGSPGPAARGATHLPCPDASIGPGHVNAHTHLYSGLVPFGVPLPEPWPTDFVTILERLWWRLDRALDARMLRAAARVAIGEALTLGTTTLVDHHESPSFIAGSLDVLAEAAEELGIRALLCYGATERNAGRDEAQAGLAESARLARQLRGHPTLGAMVGLHAGFTVSDPTISDAVALAHELDVGLHVHVAEAPADVADARARGYDGALHRLNRLGALGPRALIAHAIHVTADEVHDADANGASFVQNARSNLGNGVGYPALLARAGRVALGTDGYPSDMEAEVEIAQQQGARHGEPPALAVLRLRHGEALMGRFFATRTHRPPIDLVVRGPSGVQNVVVDGKLVVHDGRLVGEDLDALRRDARAAASDLARVMLGFSVAARARE